MMSDGNNMNSSQESSITIDTNVTPIDENMHIEDGNMFISNDITIINYERFTASNQEIEN